MLVLVLVLNNSRGWERIPQAPARMRDCEMDASGSAKCQARATGNSLATPASHQRPTQCRHCSVG